jgi:hypothetical protein
MRKFIATIVIAVLLAPTASLYAKVDSKKASYFGGSVGIFAGAKEPVQGKLNTVDPDALILSTEEPFAGQQLRIPYKQIIDLEYGQKAGRRVGAAVGYTVLLGPLGLLTLFSKKRNHFLTIGFKDEKGMDQVAVLELGKDIVRVTLPIVETRSGKKIEYQDEEAKKGK